MNDRLKGCRPLIATLVAVLLIVSAVQAETPRLRFSLADGSLIDGTLMSSDRDGELKVSTPVFDQPVSIPVTQLLEATALDGRAESQFDPPEGFPFALVLDDQSVFVGRIDRVRDRSIDIESPSLGRRTIPMARVSEVIRSTDLAELIASLSYTRFRFVAMSGWQFKNDQAICIEPNGELVGNLDLPERFRLVVRMRCSGQADLECAIVEQKPGVANGNGEVEQDLSLAERRRRLLPRFPSERFVTRLEWFDSSLSLVRSNPSVSTSAVFEQQLKDGCIELELFIDQRLGQIHAFQQGILSARVALTDDDPQVRRRLRITSRADPITIERLELYAWDGQVPESRSRTPTEVLLTNETRFEHLPDAWDGDRFRIDDQWYNVDAIKRISFGRKEKTSLMPRVILSDASQFCGEFKRSDLPMEIRIIDSLEESASIQSHHISRVFGTAQKNNMATGTPVPGQGVLLVGEQRLRGRLVASESTPGDLAWQIDVSGESLTIAVEDAAHIDFDGARTSPMPVPAGVEFTSGQQFPGELHSIAGSVIRFESDLTGTVSLKSDAVRRIWLRSPRAIESSSREMLLRLPRRFASSPPTNLLLADNGDVLRGRLISLDDARCRIEVRGKSREIPRTQICEIIWLDQQDPDPEEHRYSIETSEGIDLDLQSISVIEGPTGASITGQHRHLGAIRIRLSQLSRLTIGSRNRPAGKPWTLLPVKQPRTFQ